MPERVSGTDSAGEATRKEGQRGTTGQVHHLVETAHLVPRFGKEGPLGAVSRTKISPSMPESLDLCIGRALPGPIAPSDRQGKNSALEMIDLLRQLTALTAVVAPLASQRRRCRGRNAERERQHQAETDEETEAQA